jgi:hypothetical protein
MDETEKERAIKAAKDLYQQKTSEGLDLSSGPCISQEIIPDWCVDIVHVPRQAIDNEPTNQCELYRTGQVHHFVELDQEGNLVRAV